LFLFPVLIGVWAHGTDVVVENADNILPAMVEAHAPKVVFNLVLIGALAALMSTADSQLFVLSSMLARDLGFKDQVKKSKVITVLLALFGIGFLLFGFNPKAGIFGTLVKTTFSGLVVLFPTTMVALYKPEIGWKPCFASIVVGEVAIALFRMGWLPTFGFLDGILGLLIASATIILLHRAFRPSRAGI
jgi:SSS family solute:Na+ symporter